MEIENLGVLEKELIDKLQNQIFFDEIIIKTENIKNDQ